MVIIGWKYGDNSAGFLRMWGLAKAIAESGHDVKYIFLMPNHGWKNNEYIPNLECIYLGDKCRFKNKILTVLYSLYKLLSLIHRGDTVLYYTFLPTLFVITLVPRIRLIFEVNEYPPFIAQVNKLNKIFFKWYLSRVRNAYKIFVISKKLKNYFIEQRVNPNKIEILNMTVDQKRFINVQKQHTERYIAYCGTVSSYKDGVDILIKAFSIVTKEFDDIKLYILGNIPCENDRRKYESIIGGNHLSEKIFMPGAIPSEAIPQYLTNAEVLALARPDNIQAAYGFPTKLGEYLLTGNPVVVTRVGELEEFLIDKESCLFAKPNSVEDFAEKLLWVLKNPEKGREIGLNGRKVASMYFNSIKEAQKIISVLQ